MRSEYLDQYGIDSLKHLKLAANNGADFFVTSNEDLLADREELQKVFNIKIVLPSELPSK